MKKYLKNKFEFYGVKAPLLREIAKPFLKKHTLPQVGDVPEIVSQLWNHPRRELQYFAIELLKKYMKVEPKDWIELYEKLMVEKSWWDTVDAIAAWFVGNHFQRFPDQINPYTAQWMASGNIWLQRSCLIFQLKYKDRTDFELMKTFILPLAESKEFFLRKAIGWALREYSKIQPEKVLEFTANHSLSPLSFKEATRIILKGQSDVSH
jgi:3-methyladenine DNA glycosylase AlkD